MSTRAVPLQSRPSLTRERVSDAEWQLRCELAAAHRLVAHFVFVDMTYNHISARVPGEPNHFLVKADNVFMEQVTASNLVKYDVDGKQVMESAYKASPAAYNLHAAVMKARPDIMAAVHTHSPANLAVSAQKCGLVPITQQAMRFYNRISYYANEVDDTTAEGSRHLAQTLADKWVMILENHGALAGGTPLNIPAASVCEERVKKFGRMGQYDAKSRDWVASMALVEQRYPDYKE